MIRFTF